MSIFKAYDIRGIYGSEVTEEFASKLGNAVIKYSKPKAVVIGYDSRIGSIKLFSALVKSLVEKGCDVVHIGLVSRPMLDWVVAYYGYELGIIVTASHNPKEYNGFKFIGKHGHTLHYDNYLVHLEKIMREPNNKPKAYKKGKVISKDYIDDYVKFLSSHLSKEFYSYIKTHHLKIIGDASNGAAGEIIKRFLERNDIDYELLFADPDGNFPCHSPNPSNPNATIVLSNTVIKNKASLGFIVDADADRIRFVDEKGQVLDNNFSACIVAKYLIKKDKKKVVVHDLVSRSILGQTIRHNKGKEIISRVGFAFMNESMRKYDAIFGAEVSAHYSFRSMQYLDSGMMMLVQMLNALTSKYNKGKHLSTLVKPLDKSFDLGELTFDMPDHLEKERTLKNIHEYYKTNKKKLKVRKISTLDGVSVIFKDSWFNIRPSNTEPLLRLRGESKNKKELERLKLTVEKLIKK